MSQAKEIVSRNKTGLFDDATAPAAWAAISTHGTPRGPNRVDFADGSRVVRDPMSGAVYTENC